MCRLQLEMLRKSITIQTVKDGKTTNKAAILIKIDLIQINNNEISSLLVIIGYSKACYC